MFPINSYKYHLGTHYYLRASYFTSRIRTLQYQKL